VCVADGTGISVSKEPATSIFTVEELCFSTVNMEAVRVSEKFSLNYQSTWQNIVCQPGYFTREGDSTGAERNL
jgi:hypothetical protein